MDWFAEGRFQLEWRLVCLGLSHHMGWVEALLLVHKMDDLDYKAYGWWQLPKQRVIRI